MTHRNPYNSINRQTRRSILIRRIRVSTSNNGSLSSQQSLTIMRMSPSGQNRSTKSNMKRRMTRARANSVLSRRQISSSNRHRYNSSRSQRLGRNMSRRPTSTKPRITKDGGVLRILRSCRFVSRLTATMYTATLNSLARRTKVSNPSSKRSRRRERRSNRQYRRHPTNTILTLLDTKPLQLSNNAPEYFTLHLDDKYDRGAGPIFTGGDGAVAEAATPLRRRPRAVQGTKMYTPTFHCSSTERQES